MANTQKNSAVDVYSVGEIARAAGVATARVEALVASGEVRALAISPRFFAPDQAIAAVRALGADGGRAAALMFDKPEFAHASAKMPIAAASAVHAGIAATLILISAVGVPQAAETPVRIEPVTTRLVFIASPGPGGGGGGGGLRQKAPPPRAQRKGKSSLDSPVPVRKAPKPIEAAPKPEPPPPPPPVQPEPLPPVVAPVATVAANDVERAWRHRRAGAEGKRKSRTWNGWRRWIGHRHWSRKRRRVGHRRRIGWRDGRRAISARQRCLTAANSARSEGRLHGGRAARQCGRRSRARDCRAPRRFGRRREAVERAAARLERPRDCGGASVAFCACNTTGSGGRRHRRGCC